MLSYCHQGDPSCPPCVFLHGFLGVKEDWKEMWDELSSRLFCIGIDLPGHGKSSSITSDYLNVLARAIHHVCQQKSVLIGYSMGGRIALQLSAQHPDRFSHVILLSADPGLKENERESRLLQDKKWVEKLKSSTMETFLEEWYAQPLFQSLHKRPHLLKRLIGERKQQNPKHLADVLWTLSPAREPAILSFPSRILFLYGEEDEKYQKIYSALPKKIKVHKIEQSGHVIHLENPKSCALALGEYLEEHP